MHETESEYLEESASSAEALRRSEIRYRNLFENASDGIFIYDLKNGRLLEVNKAACELLGYCREELMQKSLADLLTPENANKASKRIDKLRRCGHIFFETAYICHDGSHIPLEASTSLIEHNEKPAIITFARDITDRKHVEEEKKRLETQLVQAQRVEAIGTLAAGIAHNFNNLLMGIQGNTSIILLDMKSDHPHYKNLNNIEKLVQNGSKLTSHLLGYAREGRYETKSVSLNRIVKETLDTFHAAKKEIRLHMELSENLFCIKADQGQIEQILLNLYVNAADAMPGGGDIFLETKNVTYKDMSDKPYGPIPGNYVLLTVRDTGVGMDKETMKRVFEPFFTTKGLARGTGLGLASTYGIIKAHGGYIDVDSKEGHGTAFSIYLPATKMALKERVEKNKEILKGKETVLLVDDENLIADTGEQMLKILGYKVLLARGGQDALEQYENNKENIGIVILDMVMPDMGGGETYDRMKEIDPDVKVLLSSGYSIDGEASEILQRGCNAFIQKPFRMEQLSQKLREVIEMD